MKVEIEVKMRLVNREVLEERLREVGARPQPEILESNTYFDKRCGELKSSDRGLRVRRTQSANDTVGAKITYKGPRTHGKLKSRVESEVHVDDPRDAAELLTALGYFPTLSFEKKRVTWCLDDCLVELDTLPYLGDYVEIEGESDQSVLAVRKKIGLENAPILRASYISMLVTYIHEHHLSENIVTFAGQVQPA